MTMLLNGIEIGQSVKVVNESHPLYGMKGTVVMIIENSHYSPARYLKVLVRISDGNTSHDIAVGSGNLRTGKYQRVISTEKLNKYYKMSLQMS